MLKIRGHSIAHLDPLDINIAEVPENSTTKAIHASFNFGKFHSNSESTWLRYTMYYVSFTLLYS